MSRPIWRQIDLREHMNLHGSKWLTNLVEQQNELLRGAALAHIALHVGAARAEGISSIQDLDDDVSSLHHLDKLLIEGPPGVVCTLLGLGSLTQGHTALQPANASSGRYCNAHTMSTRAVKAMSRGEMPQSAHLSRSPVQRWMALPGLTQRPSALPLLHSGRPQWSAHLPSHHHADLHLPVRQQAVVLNTGGGNTQACTLSCGKKRSFPK